jgi:hypothetical protein
MAAKCEIISISISGGMASGVAAKMANNGSGDGNIGESASISA